jgi:uroporphyrinogen-III decarboxylase
LGAVVEDAARRYRTPLAFPLMDLRLEKADLLDGFNIPAEEADRFAFSEPPGQAAAMLHRPFAKRNQAHIDAVRYIATRTDLLPVGMAIGPFSLTTKLMADPIPAIALAGGGVSPEDSPEVALLERCFEVAEETVHRSVQAQIDAGAKAILICEPAANIVYISPRQLARGSDVFERFVLTPNERIADRLANAGVDLIFHDCGELTSAMVHAFATRLNPAILSLGSSRKLWEDAAVIPMDVVLFGNLPTKNFYSDAAVPIERVEEMTRDLIRRMAETGHPYIVGSECDVLFVPDAAATIRAKVDAMLHASARYPI